MGNNELFYLLAYVNVHKLFLLFLIQHSNGRILISFDTSLFRLISVFGITSLFSVVVLSTVRAFHWLSAKYMALTRMMTSSLTLPTIQPTGENHSRDVQLSGKN